jgi:hypothetical protein
MTEALTIHRVLTFDNMTAWQWLLDTGRVWHLPKWFGHMAVSLVASGALEGA